MPSVWVERRVTAGGRTRYLVKYRLGGRESAHRYAGSFATKRAASARRALGCRMNWPHYDCPDTSSLELEQPTPRPPTMAEVSERWRAARVDVADGTRCRPSSCSSPGCCLDPRRATPRPVTTSTSSSSLVVQLARGSARKRETIRKCRHISSPPVLDLHGVKDNPARDPCTFGCRARNVELSPARPRPNTLRPSFGSCRAPTHSRSSCSTASGIRVGELHRHGPARTVTYDEPATPLVRPPRRPRKDMRRLWVSLPPDALRRRRSATLPATRGPRRRPHPLFPG